MLALVRTVIFLTLICVLHKSQLTFARDSQNVLLDKKIGQMIIVGFHGYDIEGNGISDDMPVDWVQQVHSDIEKGYIGGIILFRYNIKNEKQLKELVTYFNNIGYKIKPWISVDCEGGKVQRLAKINGFKDFPSAKQIAKMNIRKASKYYQEMANMLKTSGINLNFAPVVDIDMNCSVIGGLQRSYGDYDHVIKYSTVFIDAMEKEGIMTTLKHFPGHGSAKNDTHEGYTDVTDYYQEIELMPYRTLIDKYSAVMLSHIVHKIKDPCGYPASLSKNMGDILRSDIGFDGLIVSDDLHMGAIQKHYNLKEIVLTSIKAGVDIMIFSNNPSAAKNVEGFKPDPYIAKKIIKIVKDAIAKKELDVKLIDDAYNRIIKVKSKYHLVQQ